MATIRENRKNGKVVSYCFTACLERDARGKQVRKYTTWTPPSDLTPAKAKRAAERAAMEWEDEIRAEHQERKEAAASGKAYSLPPEKRQDDLTAFVKDIWLPLQIRGGSRKATTIVFYENLAKVITRYFDGAVMREISPMQIQRYLIYLRTEYKSVLHKPLSAKSVRHADFPVKPELIGKLRDGAEKIIAGEVTGRPTVFHEHKITAYDLGFATILCDR